MSKVCHVSECLEKVYYGCTCSDDLFLCLNHSGSHFISFGDHIPKKLIVKIPEMHLESMRKYMSDYSNKLNQNIINLKSFTIKLINGIQKESCKLLSKLISERKKIKKSLKDFTAHSLIDIEYHDSHFINNRNSLQKLNFNYTNLFETIKKSFDRPIFESIFSNDEYAIIFKKEMSGDIDLVDLKNYTLKTKQLIYKGLAKECICCKIDFNQFFVYGGHSGNDYIHFAQIIDINNDNYIPVPFGSKLGNAGACFYDKNIYCFGGIPEYKNCFVFNMDNRKWTNIGNLPEQNNSYFNKYMQKLNKNPVFISIHNILNSS